MTSCFGCLKIHSRDNEDDDGDDDDDNNDDDNNECLAIARLPFHNSLIGILGHSLSETLKPKTTFYGTSFIAL